MKINNVKLKYVEKQGWLVLKHMEQLVLGTSKRGNKVGFCLVLVFLVFSL